MPTKMNKWKISPFYNRILPFRKYFIIILDSIIVFFSFLFAFLLRFDFFPPSKYIEMFYATFPIVMAARIFSFKFFKLHSSSWAYFSLKDFKPVVLASTFSSLVIVTIILLILGHGFPRGVLFLDWILCIGLICSVRLVGRLTQEVSTGWHQKIQDERRVIIIGAGDAGEMLLREILRGALNICAKYSVVGFVDDDPFKKEIMIQGCNVLGNIDDLPAICQTQMADEILIALPSANRDDRRRVLRNCRQTGIPFKTIPSLENLYNGRSYISQVQEVEAGDILERDPVILDHHELWKEIKGKQILVTGAAGSIGSELCRQVAHFDPAEIILYDQAESNLFFLDLELKKKFPSIGVKAIVGDILNERLLDEVIRIYTPEFLFHAAAYKHVPLMEACPLEAIQNNVFGSEIVGLAAIKGGVRKFVFISTDKAVQPVSVMGMTKRLSECLFQTLSDVSTKFIAVRFGNVLGSDGSVLPIFKEQIERGESLTVTDSKATRYFMLIPEAAKLVIQVAIMGRGSEIFFLDMGDPVPIMHMAEKLVQYSGFELHKDVSINLSGLRPGERLQEDLIGKGESLLSTEHKKIFGVSSQPVDIAAFKMNFEELKFLVDDRRQEKALAKLKEMVKFF